MSLLRRLFRLPANPRHGDPLPKEDASTDERTILDIARQRAESKGLAWIEPIHAEYLHGSRGPVWLVTTNWMGRGHTVHVTIDDETREVIGARSLPR